GKLHHPGLGQLRHESRVRSGDDGDGRSFALRPREQDRDDDAHGDDAEDDQDVAPAVHGPARRGEQRPAGVANHSETPVSTSATGSAIPMDARSWTIALMYVTSAATRSFAAESAVCSACVASLSEIRPLRYWSCAMRADSSP